MWKPTAAAVVLVCLTACGGGSSPLGAKKSPSPPAETVSPTPRATVPNGAVYTDTDGFTITYPASWTTKMDVSGLSVVAALPETIHSAFANNIGVIVERTKLPTLSVKDYLDASVANASKLIMEFHLVSRSTQTIDGTKQGVLEYTGTVQSKSLHFLAYVEVHRGNAYTATYTATPEAFETYRAEAVPILESLRLT